MGKLETLKTYISECDQILKTQDAEQAKWLITKIVHIYDAEIPVIHDGLGSYGFSSRDIYCFDDIELLRGKLNNYLENLDSGLYKILLGKGDTLSVSQHNEMKTELTFNISLTQTVDAIDKIDSNELSDDDKDALKGKLLSLEKMVVTEKDKTKVWSKATGILKWVADRGVDVGIACIPYIASALQNLPK